MFRPGGLYRNVVQSSYCIPMLPLVRPTKNCQDGLINAAWKYASRISSTGSLTVIVQLPTIESFRFRFTSRRRLRTQRRTPGGSPRDHPQPRAALGHPVLDRRMVLETGIRRAPNPGGIPPASRPRGLLFSRRTGRVYGISRRAGQSWDVLHELGMGAAAAEDGPHQPSGATLPERDALGAGTADVSAQAPKLGIALSGGGGKGAYQVGVLRVLRAAGVRPDVIAGTSVGAINATLLCLDDLEVATKFWSTVSFWQVAKVGVANLAAVPLLVFALITAGSSDDIDWRMRRMILVRYYAWLLPTNLLAIMTGSPWLGVVTNVVGCAAIVTLGYLADSLIGLLGLALLSNAPLSATIRGQCSVGTPPSRPQPAVHDGSCTASHHQSLPSALAGPGQADSGGTATTCRNTDASRTSPTTTYSDSCCRAPQFRSACSPFAESDAPITWTAELRTTSDPAARRRRLYVHHRRSPQS